MRFPPHFLDRLRGHFLLSEVIGRRVTLRRHGREFMGLCPFHKEKSPSFTVNDEKRFYHCFGCGAHGDAINFLKDHDGLSYVEAVEKLAGEAGLALPEPAPEAAEAYRRAASLYDVMEVACRWFESQLALPAGAAARDYLQQRAISERTRAVFRLGYAPNQRDGLKQALMKQSISEAALIEAGLLIKLEGEAAYDRFRGRLIFPIRDAQGKVVAFGGRILNNDNPKLAKYLNSPETPLFHKGDMLYNADLARKPAYEVKSVIVAEGYMDVIALAQAGIGHAVAPLGTAVTEAQLAALWRICPEPVFCLDGDAAGLRAMGRAAELALGYLKPGLSLRFVMLPGKEDPDSLIRHQGVEAMQRALKNARELSDVLWELNAPAAGQRVTPEHKAAIEHRLMQLCEKIADVTVRAHYRSYFKGMLWQKGGPASRKPEEIRPPALPEGEMAVHRFERQLLQLALRHPALLHHAEIEENFARMEFTHGMLDKLRQATLEVLGYSESITCADLRHQLEKQGFAESVRRLMEDDLVPRAVLAEEVAAEQVLAVWRQIVSAYTVARMEREYRQAVTRMAEDMTEAAFSRCAELQRQIEAARRAQLLAVSEEFG